MCQGCWIRLGRPATITEATKLAAAAVRDLYAVNSIGGLMHIVTDDWNVDDLSVEFCGDLIKAAEGGTVTDRIELAAARKVHDLMAPMSVQQRASTLAIVDGFVSQTGTEG